MDFGAIFALEPDAGAMVPVFALFAIGFCLVGRYRWIILCALMIILFLAFAIIDQLTAVLGLSLQQIVDMQAGIVPEGISARALARKIPVFENTTADTGIVLVGIGMAMLELAPWLRRFGGALPEGGLRRRREPVLEAAEPVETPAPGPAVIAPGDMLVDGIYFFAEGLQRPMSFTLLNAAGQMMDMRVTMMAAGYLGDTYFLRCRDMDVGNLRDVPAHMLSNIVDEDSGETIDTDELLNDLAQVAYEVIESSQTGEPGEAIEETQPQPA